MIVVNGDYRSVSYAPESTRGLPLRVGLIVDASGSVQRTLVDHVVGGAVRFLRETLRANDAAFVISVHEQISVAQDWTSDGGQIFSAVTKIRTGGGTALFDGIYFACKKLAAESSISRKAVIVASDGNDNVSRASSEEVIKFCEQNSIAVHTLNEVGARVSNWGALVLRRISEKTGGFYYAPSNDKEIIEATDQLGLYWNAQYVGTATFQTLPENKKIKDVYVLSAADQLKFKATVLPESSQ